MRNLIEEMRKSNPSLISAALAIDAATVEAGLRELSRRQTGIFGIPESELLPEAERITADFVARRAKT